MDFVFVYGTLKRGFPYHESGMKRARFFGRCRTLEAYPLVVGGHWFSPILLAEPGVGRRVIGEVYQVDDAGLAELDSLEGGHLPTGYQRAAIAVEPVDGGAAFEPGAISRTAPASTSSTPTCWKNTPSIPATCRPRTAPPRLCRSSTVDA